MPDSEPSVAKTPLTDSPWFWVLLFGGMACVALVAIGPKYARRQEAVERRFQAREEIAERRATGQGLLRSDAEHEPPPEERELIVPLWPLGLGLALIVIGVAVRQLRHRSSVSPP